MKLITSQTTELSDDSSTENSDSDEPYPKVKYSNFILILIIINLMLDLVN